MLSISALARGGVSYTLCKCIDLDEVVDDGSMKAAKLRGRQQGFLINLVAARAAAGVPAFGGPKKA